MNELYKRLIHMRLRHDCPHCVAWQDDLRERCAAAARTGVRIEVTFPGIGALGTLELPREIGGAA